jgi:hypothetical protein
MVAAPWLPLRSRLVDELVDDHRDALRQRLVGGRAEQD